MAVLTRQWNLGHLLLGAMLLATLALGWRAFQVAREPLPVPPPFSAPPMADRGLLARLDPFFPVRADPAGSLPVTALPISLHGVRADSATGRGSAIIASADGVQQVYAVGDTLAEGVTLAAIAADHVVVDRGGTREALWLDTAGAGAVQRFDPTQPNPVPQSMEAVGAPEMPDQPPSDAQGGAAEMPALPQNAQHSAPQPGPDGGTP